MSPRLPAPDRRRRDHALAIWRAGVDAVHAGRLVRRALRIDGGVLRAGDAAVDLAGIFRVLVVGGGKAGAAMAGAVEQVFDATGPAVEGLLNVPDDTLAGEAPVRRIELVAARATHVNRPTAEAAEGTRRMLELVESARASDLVLCLLSGGASALLPAPAPGLTLEDKQAVTDLLLASGAPIARINVVRKHLSAIKGGRLATAAGEAPVVSLILSDVVGDPLDVIASGPTAPDHSTYAGALRVLETCRLERRVPPAVLRHLRRGAAGEIPETPKRLGPNVRNVIVGNNATAREAAAAHAEALGYRVVDLGSEIEGESRDAGAALAERADEERSALAPGAQPVCVVSGGETTVTLRGRPGRGGPNQELVLGAAVILAGDGMRDLTLLSGGTDGEDGPTDAAGAFVDVAMLAEAERRRLDPAAFLEAHDAYTFFDAIEGLVRTGPTRTNVMDLRVALIDPPR